MRLFMLGRPCFSIFGFGLSLNKVWRIEHLIWRGRWVIDSGKRVTKDKQPERNAGL